MGNEFENREQRRKMKKSRAKSGKAKATRATAVMMAALMATSGMSLPTGIFAYGAENNKLLAFAGAEGGGRYATGGRGYDIYVVTNLEDYGRNDKPVEGSLRYGIEEAAKNNGGTMIVFNVGGTIALKQKLTFAGRKNITLAGQTAPGDGITLSGYDTDISDSENLIIRYMRFRPGAANVQAVILWMHSGAGTIKHLLLTIVHSVGIQMRQFQLTEVKTVRFSGVLFLRVLLFPDTQRDVTDTAVFLAAIMCYSAITLWLTIHQEIRELAAAAWATLQRTAEAQLHCRLATMCFITGDTIHAMAADMRIPIT